ncbi:hypothetical protein HAL07_15980 [Helicobacter ailurogastricus]|uniref:Uncharacterized protein n=1 Tax=Helicobacter ailurogastricus TaxID=1578720 RepID=A0A0K2Y2E2_9HELI|nr:hypothetical protein HAL07_15980 [Helicobacter ailurogastricus]
MALVSGLVQSSHLLLNNFLRAFGNLSHHSSLLFFSPNS